MGKKAKKEIVKTEKTPLSKKKRNVSEATNDAGEEKESNIVLNPVRKRKRGNVYNPEEEARLESLVFGDPSDVIKNLTAEAKPDFKIEIKREEKIDYSDILGSDDADDDSDKESDVLPESDDESSITLDSKDAVKAAWHDSDDEDLSVSQVLKEQHRRLPGGRPEKMYTELLQNKFAHIVGTPKWAKVKRDKEEDSADSDDEILKHSNHLVSRKSKSLPKGNIDIKVLSHINKQTHVEGPFINSVQFHETSTVALVAGSQGVLSLFEVDGRENNKLHTLKFERFPINTARFLKEGTEVLVGSMSHAFCHSYDLMSGKTLRIPLPHGITNMKRFEVSPNGKLIAVCGRLGEIYLLNSSTKEIIDIMKMNKKCRDLAFTPDGSKLISHGESSEIYVWDINTRTCVNRAFDDGCLSACSVAVSPNGQFIATGSKQGAVNIYDAKTVLNEKTPTPVKTVLNLVTAITKVKFNPTSEMLAIASDRKANAFKMIHIPSFHVFSNFPTFNTKMFNPLDIDFSPASGYMSVGNNKGFAYLYRLKHFGNY